MTLKYNNNYDSSNSSILLLHVTGAHEQEDLAHEFQLIKKYSGRDDFQLMSVGVDDWNQDLAPWSAPPAFGAEPFGDGAGQTLQRILEIPMPEKVLLGGYSLAGLFALWASYQTERFAGVAAVSPSVWYPGWLDYAKEHSCQSEKVYLSLGRKEEKTRNKVMAQVGEAIRAQAALLEDRCVLEWNDGNHFFEPDVRTAKGFAWLLRDL